MVIPVERATLDGLEISLNEGHRRDLRPDYAAALLATNRSPEAHTNYLTWLNGPNGRKGIDCQLLDPTTLLGPNCDGYLQWRSSGLFNHSAGGRPI